MIFVILYSVALLILSYSFHTISKAADPKRRLIKTDMPRLGDNIVLWRKMHKAMAMISLCCAGFMTFFGFFIASLNLKNYIPLDIAETGIFVLLVAAPIYWAQRR